MIEWDALLSMIELSRLAKVWLSLVKKLNPTKSNLAHERKTGSRINPKSNKKRKASAPFQFVIYFPLCQHMLLCWKAPIMLVIMPA